MGRKSDKRDSLAAVLVLIGAHATAQAALIALRVSGIIGWHWAAVLAPTWIVSALFFGVITFGSVLGIVKTIRQHRREREIEARLEEELERFLRKAEAKQKAEDLVRSLEEEDNE